MITREGALKFNEEYRKERDEQFLKDFEETIDFQLSIGIHDMSQGRTIHLGMFDSSRMKLITVKLEEYEDFEFIFQPGAFSSAVDIYGKLK